MPMVNGKPLPYPPGQMPPQGAPAPTAMPPGAGTQGVELPASSGPGTAAAMPMQGATPAMQGVSGGAMAPDPREQMVADFVRQRLGMLTQQERNILGAAATPEFAAVMFKLFGGGIIDLLDQAVTYNQGLQGGMPAGPGSGLRSIGG